MGWIQHLNRCNLGNQGKSVQRLNLSVVLKGFIHFQKPLVDLVPSAV